MTVAVSEIAFIQWMIMAPLDVTASPILRGSMWAQLFFTGVGVAALIPVFRRNARVYVGAYLALTTGLYLFFMLATLNPAGFAILYVAPVLGGILLWSWLLRHKISAE
ncbi:MAG: hypothetical protein GKR90_24730 [Pseudomonadales bacterium]|nr:hypothetical protein [Pseudomonadales bacterium]